jgi:hypothetical protein
MIREVRSTLRAHTKGPFRSRSVERSLDPRRQRTCSAEVSPQLFQEVIEGNGSRLPQIDDWARFYRELKCSQPTSQKNRA